MSVIHRMLGDLLNQSPQDERINFCLYRWSSIDARCASGHLPDRQAHAVILPPRKNAETMERYKE